MGGVGPQGTGGANGRLGGQGVLGLHLGREGRRGPQGGLGPPASRTSVPHEALGHPGSGSGANYNIRE